MHALTLGVKVGNIQVLGEMRRQWIQAKQRGDRRTVVRVTVLIQIHRMSLKNALWRKQLLSGNKVILSQFTLKFEYSTERRTL